MRKTVQLFAFTEQPSSAKLLAAVFSAAVAAGGGT